MASNLNQSGRGKSFSPFSTILVFVALVIMGAAMIPLLNIQLNPSRTTASITIRYSWSGASAINVEREVTSKLEGMFSVISGLEDIRSESRLGNGMIVMSFKKSANLDALRFEIATIIRRVYPQLPPEVSYPQISLGTGGSPTVSVLTYTLASGAAPYFIKQYAEENIVPRISLIPGVNELNVYGAAPFRYEIIFDLVKARTLGITGSNIRTAVNNHFRNDFVGIAPVLNGLGNGNDEYRVFFTTRLGDALDWEKIPIQNNQGRIIYLSDLARVVYKEEDPTSFHRINGLNTINMVVYAGEGVNNIKLAKEVKAEIDRIRISLPSGFSILLAYDATRYLNDELRQIGMRTLYSILILLAFVWFISRRVRYLLFIASSLFANLVIAVIFYYLLRLEIHLYSLAGITVSFGIIIDNSIVMIDHYRYQRNKQAFLAILAATLTTIGSLCVIFFLTEQQQINLIDFTWVMIVNLGISLLIALFFIPSLQELIPLTTKRNKVFIRRKRRINRMSGHYIRIIIFSRRWKWAFIVLFILGFGIPVHWLPDNIDRKSGWAEVYNKSLGSESFKKVRPAVEKILGGSLRLFSENIFNRSFYSDPQRTTLHVRASMPEGCTIQQLNDVIKIMENFLSGYDEIEMYQTTISSYNNSSINIYFKPEFELGGFPYFLKESIISKAVGLGGADWGVYGVGQGFSNALYSSSSNSWMEISGYNYEQLYQYAELLADSLGKFERVQNLEITGESGYRAQNALHEFVVDFDREAMAMQVLTLQDYYSYLQDDAYYTSLAPVYDQGERTPVALVSDGLGEFDKWILNNESVRRRDITAKFASIGSIGKRRTGNNIYKQNQQYRLYVAFDFIGHYQLLNLITENLTKSINAVLPMGYKISEDNRYYYRSSEEKKQYILIFLVIGIIYFICAILLESFVQPLAVIAMIPVSFIGVFLTFYIFGFNFDQGGFAAFILLCGLSVNSALYILNDYNVFLSKRSDNKLRTYIKAFHHKIIPAVLTILSTMLGLIPFIIGGQNEVFWFAFAAATIGGLSFSLVGIFIYFPLFLRLSVTEGKENITEP